MTSSGVSVTASSLAAVVLVGAVLHGCFVVLNSWACRAFKLGGGDNPDSYVHEGMGKGSKEDRQKQGEAPVVMRKASWLCVELVTDVICMSHHLMPTRIHAHADPVIRPAASFHSHCGGRLNTTVIDLLSSIRL